MKNQIKRNERLRDDLIDCLTKEDAFAETKIYCNNHIYTAERREGFKQCKTAGDSVYYDGGYFDVRDAVEYNNPETVTMTFEGPLYDQLNSGWCEGCIEDKLNKIGEKYGLYLEQGYGHKYYT